MEKVIIRRYPPVYQISEPPKKIPRTWSAWYKGFCIGKTIRRQTLERCLRNMGRQYTVDLRYGDNGRNRYRPLIRWLKHRIRVYGFILIK